MASFFMGSLSRPRKRARVGFVFGEEQRGVPSKAIQRLPYCGSFSSIVFGRAGALTHPRALDVMSPGPGVAEPDGGEQVDFRRFGPAIGDGDADQDVFGRGLGVFGENVEVAIVVENAGVVELELGVSRAAAAVFVDAAARRERRACGYLYRYFM